MIIIIIIKSRTIESSLNSNWNEKKVSKLSFNSFIRSFICVVLYPFWVFLENFNPNIIVIQQFYYAMAVTQVGISQLAQKIEKKREREKNKKTALQGPRIWSLINLMMMVVVVSNQIQAFKRIFLIFSFPKRTHTICICMPLCKIKYNNNNN